MASSVFELDDPVTQHADALDLALHNVTILQPFGRTHAERDARRGARDDHVASLEGHQDERISMMRPMLYSMSDVLES